MIYNKQFIFSMNESEENEKYYFKEFLNICKNKKVRQHLCNTLLKDKIFIDIPKKEINKYLTIKEINNNNYQCILDYYNSVIKKKQKRKNSKKQNKNKNKISKKKLNEEKYSKNKKEYCKIKNSLNILVKLRNMIKKYVIGKTNNFMNGGSFIDCTIEKYNCNILSSNYNRYIYIVSPDLRQSTKIVVKYTIEELYIADYMKEGTIYDKFKDENYVLNLYGHGTAIKQANGIYMFEYNGKSINLKIEDSLQNENYYYLILEYNNNYKKFCDYLNEDTPPVIKLKAFILVYESIFYIHNNYDFVHADLKTDNVFIEVNENEEPIMAKHYDFDSSYYKDVCNSQNITCKWPDEFNWGNINDMFVNKKEKLLLLDLWTFWFDIVITFVQKNIDLQDIIDEYSIIKFMKEPVESAVNPETVNKPYILSLDKMNKFSEKKLFILSLDKMNKFSEKKLMEIENNDEIRSLVSFSEILTDILQNDQLTPELKKQLIDSDQLSPELKTQLSPELKPQLIDSEQLSPELKPQLTAKLEEIDTKINDAYNSEIIKLRNEPIIDELLLFLKPNN